MPFQLKSFFRMCLFCIVFIILFTIPSPASSENRKDELNIEKDKDKTVYTIGSSQKDKKDQAEEDKKNSWEMLKNSNLWIRK
mgnify:CR=1 FL=1